jgi:hypothetical protein
MIVPAQLLFADVAASIGSGAVLTLVLPLGLTLVTFVVWYLVLRRDAGRRSRQD